MLEPFEDICCETSRSRFVFKSNIALLKTLNGHNVCTYIYIVSNGMTAKNIINDFSSFRDIRWTIIVNFDRIIGIIIITYLGVRIADKAQNFIMEKCFVLNRICLRHRLYVTYFRLFQQYHGLLKRILEKFV